MVEGGWGTLPVLGAFDHSIAPILGRERMFYLCKELCSTESLIFLRVWPSKLWVDKILQPLKHSVCFHWMPIQIRGMSLVGPAFLWPPPRESVPPLSGRLCSSSSPVLRPGPSELGLCWVTSTQQRGLSGPQHRAQPQSQNHVVAIPDRVTTQKNSQSRLSFHCA